EPGVKWPQASSSSWAESTSPKEFGPMRRAPAAMIRAARSSAIGTRAEMMRKARTPAARASSTAAGTAGPGLGVAGGAGVAGTGGDDPGCEVLGVRHAGGDDEEGAHAGGQGLVDGGGHGGSGNGDDEQFGDLGQLGQMRERRSALDRGGPGVDEVDAAPVRTGQRTGREPEPPFARIVRCSEDGDAAGIEERLHDASAGPL